MTYTEVIVVYLCALTLYPVSYAAIVFIGRVSRERTKPFSRGERWFLFLRIVVFVFVAVIGWVMYFSPRFYDLIIPITAFLDLGGMFVMLLGAERIVKYFDATHAA